MSEQPENVDGWTSATEPLSDTESQKLDSMLDDILGDLETLTPTSKASLVADEADDSK